MDLGSYGRCTIMFWKSYVWGIQTQDTKHLFPEKQNFGLKVLMHYFSLNTLSFTSLYSSFNQSFWVLNFIIPTCVFTSFSKCFILFLTHSNDRAEHKKKSKIKPPWCHTTFMRKPHNGEKWLLSISRHVFQMKKKKNNTGCLSFCNTYDLYTNKFNFSSSTDCNYINYIAS